MRKSYQLSKLSEGRKGLVGGREGVRAENKQVPSSHESAPEWTAGSNLPWDVPSWVSGFFRKKNKKPSLVATHDISTACEATQPLSLPSRSFLPALSHQFSNASNKCVARCARSSLMHSRSYNADLRIYSFTIIS